MLRWSALLGIALILPLYAGASAATVDPSAFVGEWTPDTTSAAELAGHSFTFTTATEDQAVAAMNRGPSDPNFDQYCASATQGVAPVTYFVFTFTWDNGGVMGGCKSAKTGPHVYFWGSDFFDVGFAHFATVNGEEVLKGQWTKSGTALSFTAHRPDASFLAHVKYTVVGKRGGHAAELITATGAGALAFSVAPASCEWTSVVDGTGAVAVDVVKIGGPNLVELDKVTVKIAPAAGQYKQCAQRQDVKSVPVVVTKSDPAEKDACPVGSKGVLYLTDGGPAAADGFAVGVAKCHLSISLSQAKAPKGSHVAVALDFNEKGY